jgi:hypothetical protein
MQIFKNSGAQEVIVSSVQTKLYGSVSRLERAVSIDRFGILLAKFGSVV